MVIAFSQKAENSFPMDFVPLPDLANLGLILVFGYRICSFEIWRLLFQEKSEIVDDPTDLLRPFTRGQPNGALDSSPCFKGLDAVVEAEFHEAPG